MSELTELLARALSHQHPHPEAVTFRFALSSTCFIVNQRRPLQTRCGQLHCDKQVHDRKFGRVQISAASGTSSSKSGSLRRSSRRPRQQPPCASLRSKQDARRKARLGRGGNAVYILGSRPRPVTAVNWLGFPQPVTEIFYNRG